MDEYNDTSFHMALNYHLLGNRTESEHRFRNGEDMWNHYGFMDEAAEEEGEFLQLQAQTVSFHEALCPEAFCWMGPLCSPLVLLDDDLYVTMKIISID